MPAMIELKLGSYDLDASNGIGVREVQLNIQKRLQVSDLALSPGSVAPSVERSSIQIPVALQIKGSSYSALRTNLDNLLAQIESSGQKKFTIDDDRYVMATLESPDIAWALPQRLIELRLNMVIPYPFWLAETALQDIDTPTSAVGYTIAGGAGNVRSRTKITITNGSGGAVVDDIRLENETTGERFEFSGSLANTKSLVIDNFHSADLFTVLNDGAQGKANYHGDRMHMNPGNNTWKLTSAAAPNLTVTIDWRPTYL